MKIYREMISQSARRGHIEFHLDEKKNRRNIIEWKLVLSFIPQTMFSVREDFKQTKPTWDNRRRDLKRI